jgi:hypothetical protein
MTCTRYRCGLALLLITLPALALATVTFERRWHWFREDIGRSVALTADGGYLVGGQTWVDSSDYRMVLVRTDSLGDTISVRYVPGAGNGSGYLCRLSGGGFVAAGVRGGAYLFARGFNPAGDSAWSYDQSHRGQVRAILATNDGGCLIAGRDSMLDMGLTRLDSAGNEEWSRGYDDPLIQGSTAFGIAETRDTGFILCGDATDYMGSYVRLVRTNSVGDTLWTRLVSGPVGPSLRAVSEMPDGGFLAAGFEFDTTLSHNAVYLMRTDSNGVITWTRSISLPDAGTQATVMRETRDGGYVIAGSIDWSDSARVWLVKLDAGADTVWTSVVAGHGREQAVDVRQTPDGGYAIAGTSDSPGDSILLVKTDSLGLVPYGVVEQKPASPEPAVLSVEPNPAGSAVRIEWSLPDRSAARLSLYDASGRQVFSSSGLGTSPFGMRTSSFPQGVYLLRLESGSGSATRKLVIE